jgi:hypothetical protein
MATFSHNRTPVPAQTPDALSELVRRLRDHSPTEPAIARDMRTAADVIEQLTAAIVFDMTASEAAAVVAALERSGFAAQIGRRS